jgi:hypothetical protein
VRKGSWLSSPYTIQRELERKEKNERLNGMYSTLFVFITCFCNFIFRIFIKRKLEQILALPKGMREMRT